MHKLLVFLLRCYAKLPLRYIHAMGSALGTLIGWCMPKFLQRIQANLHQSQCIGDASSIAIIAKQNLQESGKAILETFAIWFKDYPQLKPWFKQCSGWQHVEAALNNGKGIIFLTPHLGCFEITSLYYGQFHPMTVLYRQPRQQWLLPLIMAGRQRGGITLAAANAQGVKQLLQALKRGEAIGILPDQAPLEGEGEWAPFFNRSAYTMTLAGKLAKKSGAQVLMAFGERLSQGQGYHIHVEPVRAGGIETPALLNAELERLISQYPTQYAWMYDRYKVRGTSSKKLSSNPESE